MAEINGVVEDVLGNPIKVGDTIAGAFRIGNVARIRVGTVLGFAERGNRLTVRVRWEHESGYNGAHETEITGAIEADLKRFVRLNVPATTGTIEALNNTIPVANP